jgi:predicted metalloprotease with PDZ domain
VQVNQVDFAGVDKLLADKKVGDVLKFRVKRDGLERSFDLTIGQTLLKAFAIQSIEKPSDAQLKLRHKWLGGN